MSLFCCIAKPEWYGIWTGLQSRSSVEKIIAAGLTILQKIMVLWKQVPLRDTCSCNDSLAGAGILPGPEAII
jgi:hypothetical protein